MSLDPRLNQGGKNIDIEMMERMDGSLLQVLVLAIAGLVYWGMYFLGETILEDAWMYGGGVLICFSIFLYFKWKREDLYFKEGLFLCTLICALYLVVIHICFKEVENWLIAMIGVIVNAFLIVSLPYTIMYEISFIVRKKKR